MTFTRSPMNTSTYSGNRVWKRIFRRSSIVGDGGKRSRRLWCPCEYYSLQSKPRIPIALPYLKRSPKSRLCTQHHPSQCLCSLLVASSPHRPILQLKQHGRILPSLCRQSGLLVQFVEL